MSSENDKDVKLTGLQKAMARKMIASWTDVPQFQLESEVNCEAMMAFRKKQDYKLSYTAILAKAAADTLAEFPRLNSSWAGDHIVEHEDINIGIAVDTKRGLLVPVISNADRKSLEEIMEGTECDEGKIFQRKLYDGRDAGRHIYDQQSGNVPGKLVWIYRKCSGSRYSGSRKNAENSGCGRG